jgi:hypothetical protein
MRALTVGAWLAVGALVVQPGMPGAQEPGAQDLIDRIRQIQAEQQAASQAPQQPEQATMQPEIGEDEMRAIVRESLGVEILRVEVVERDGEPAYAITVMNPPGNQNDALRVATLLFDGATGSLLGQQPTAPRAIAPGLSSAPTPSGFESGGQEIRRRSLR